MKILDFVQFGGPQSDKSGIKVGPGTGAATDDFGDRIAATVRDFVEQIAPIADALKDAGNQTDARLSLQFRGVRGLIPQCAPVVSKLVPLR